MSTITSRPCTARPETVDHNPSEQLGYWIVAVTESRGVGREVGIVGFELEFGQVLADSQTYAKTIHWLRQRPPSYLLLVAPASPHALTILHTTLKHLFSAVSLTVLPRASFASEKGYSLLKDLCSPGPQSDATLAEVRQKYYTLGAASAVIDWIQKTLIQTGKYHWERHSLNVKWLSVEGCMLVDRNTALDLELINNAISSKTKRSLFGLLNHTYTPMANRLLRSNLLAPPTDIQVIEGRLDAVQELIELEDSFFNLRKSLKILSQIDLDKLISRINSTELASSRLSSRSESGSRTITTLTSSSKQRKSSTQDPSLAITKKLELLKSLRIILRSLNPIRSALSSCSSELLRLASNIFQESFLHELSSVIELHVNEDSFIGIQKGSLAKQNVHAYAIKAGPENQLLNVARETYKENLSDAMALCEALKAEYHLPKLNFNFETRAGFMLHIKKEDLRVGSGSTTNTHDGLPEIFTNIASDFRLGTSQKGEDHAFYLLGLEKEKSTYHKLLSRDMYLESWKGFLKNSRSESRRFSDYLKPLLCSTFLPTWRALESMVSNSKGQGYKFHSQTRRLMIISVRPEFSNTLAISDGRHPIKELFDSESEEFVPNDTYANDSCSFQLVTGPNMSGKSIFLRQIALMVVMAQIGCFCPAKYASFPIFDALLTCLSKNDDIEAGLSTFSSEMKTLSSILSSLAVCKNSLVILDELGRGTSPLEGVGIAHAFSEEIIKAKSFCFFATHFRVSNLRGYDCVFANQRGSKPPYCMIPLTERLSKCGLPSLGDHIEQAGEQLWLKISSQSTWKKDSFHRGAVKNAGYGIELASIAGLPHDVLRRAEEISLQMRSLDDQAEKRGKTHKVLRSRKVLLEVCTTLKNLANHTKLSSSELAKFLKDYQKDVINRLQPDEEMTSSES
ncbi:hypothetical protein VP01_45g4 [Puccinia sorghi]|uniref:DNA mismatch repair proteins mutS family domain-containing protein n=1 Tax=Puccinia sorghi TaxID=27349 RepID=A0A0L6UNH5_9BASI|nr:hypothetical protein VP01_45g4 [Puccinia sorghi]